MPYPRFLEQVVEQDLGLFPVVAVMGARQVGKSTLCGEIARRKGMSIRTLDDPATLQQAGEDPAGLLEAQGPGGIFLDEVQRAPALVLAIKTVVDRDQRAGRFLVSGSNQPAVSRAVSESLLGRAIYRTLRPLVLGEQRYGEAHLGWSFLFRADSRKVVRELEERSQASGELDWKTTVTTGGFPRAVAEPPDRRRKVLDSYVDTYVRRDVREVLEIESPDRFEQFLRLLASRTGQELNLSGMSRELGLAVRTLGRWTDALSRSYLVERIPAWSRNAGQRLVKSPKLFMVDSALAIAAAREAEPNGFHLETLVLNDICLWRDGKPGRQLFHWRARSGPEVDFVLESRERLLPVEIKASRTASDGDIRHLRTFLAQNANAPRGVLLSNDPVVRSLDRRIVAAPWWAVL